MANTPQFVPTAENTYVISYPIHGTDAAYDFAAILARSRTCERQGDVEQACNLRYEGVKKLMDLIPDEDEVQLDWEEEENQSVLELLKRSAIDHFLVGDFEKEILKLWSEFRQTGSLPAGELIHFKKSFPVFYAEFTSNVHEVTPEYLADIESEKPLRQTLARELWLQTEHLWAQFPGFIEALRNH